MVQTAVLGYGTVGSGVVKVIDTNHDSILAKAGVDLQVKYILDLREFPGDPNEQKVVHDVEVILQDPEVRIVVETMGGVEPAFTFTKRALMAGKSVCTSNKELVATHGTELLALAREHQVSYLFEASCGGGIPIIRPLRTSLCADVIDEVLFGSTAQASTGDKNANAAKGIAWAVGVAIVLAAIIASRASGSWVSTALMMLSEIKRIAERAMPSVKGLAALQT